MYVVFLAGGIASGKSTVAKRMEALGAWRCDLDQLSRDVLGPWMPCTEAVADAFGHDLVDPETGVLNRGLLASRAFASPEQTARLEAIEHPYIREALVRALDDDCRAATMPKVAVVEIPLLDRVVDMVDLADEVACVVCPLDERERRAVGRGMTAKDFRLRAARQPNDEWLVAHADTVFNNEGTADDLVRSVDAWWDEREQGGWSHGA